jgi:signal transduction histidine kinase
MSQNEQKLMNMLKYAPVALIEMDSDGKITMINVMGEQIQAMIDATHNTGTESLLPLLPHIDPVLVERLNGFTGEAGIISRDIHKVVWRGENGPVKRYYHVMLNKQTDGTVMISLDDFTEKITQERAIRHAEVEKAVEQGKFEIASGVLHDIGNAVVGFGSYLTRTRRMTEQNDLDNLDNLVKFFKAQQGMFASCLGDDKATALVNMLAGIANAQRENYTEIGRSITEQLNIITHIQDILNIQRQYVSGHDSHDRKPVNLRSIINDCLAMLFASLDKRGIAVSLNITAESPVIKGDRTKLMQVILNILKNSLEAIGLDAGNKNIVIDLHSTDLSLVLTVNDTGCGFDNETGVRLFERNFTTKNNGTGLGLYNCKTIIESHAGTMTLTSEGPGMGALTTIEFLN